MFDSDVATGDVDLAGDAGYSSTGPASVRNVTNALPDLVENVCYQLSPNGTCTVEQLTALADGTAEVEDFVVVKPAGTTGQRSGGGGDGGSDGDGDGNGGGGSGGVRLRTSLVVAIVPIALAVLL